MSKIFNCIFAEASNIAKYGKHKKDHAIRAIKRRRERLLNIAFERYNAIKAYNKANRTNRRARRNAKKILKQQIKITGTYDTDRIVSKFLNQEKPEPCGACYEKHNNKKNKYVILTCCERNGTYKTLCISCADNIQQGQRNPDKNIIVCPFCRADIRRIASCDKLKSRQNLMSTVARIEERHEQETDQATERIKREIDERNNLIIINNLTTQGNLNEIEAEKIYNEFRKYSNPNSHKGTKKKALRNLNIYLSYLYRLIYNEMYNTANARGYNRHTRNSIINQCIKGVINRYNPSLLKYMDFVSGEHTKHNPNIPQSYFKYVRQLLITNANRKLNDNRRQDLAERCHDISQLDIFNNAPIGDVAYNLYVEYANGTQFDTYAIERQLARLGNKDRKTLYKYLCMEDVEGNEKVRSGGIIETNFMFASLLQKAGEWGPQYINDIYIGFKKYDIKDEPL